MSGEPERLAGITSLTSALLLKGTSARDAAQFELELDRIAASSRTQVSPDGAALILEVPTKYAERGIDLFFEALASPAFGDSEIDRLRDQEIAQMRLRNSDVRQLSEIAIKKALYSPSDRRSCPDQGRIQTIERIDGEAVRARYQQMASASVEIVSVGGMPSTDVRDVVAAGIERHQLELSTFDPQAGGTVTPAASALSPRTTVFDRPGAKQAALQLASHTVTRHDPRWASLMVAARVLGQGLRSRLNLRLREQMGYTYGVNTQTIADSAAGSLVYAGTVSADVTGAALGDAVHILDQFHDEGPSADEVTTARTAIVSQMPIELQSPGALLRTLLRNVEQRLDENWTRQNPRAIAEIDVATVANDYRSIVSSPLTVVVAGDAATVVPRLEEHGIHIDDEVRG